MIFHIFKEIRQTRLESESDRPDGGEARQIKSFKTKLLISYLSTELYTRKKKN